MSFRVGEYIVSYFVESFDRSKIHCNRFSMNKWHENSNDTITVHSYENLCNLYFACECHLNSIQITANRKMYGNWLNESWHCRMYYVRECELYSSHHNVSTETKPKQKKTNFEKNRSFWNYSDLTLNSQINYSKICWSNYFLWQRHRW